MLLDWSDFPILYFYSHFFNKSNSITAFSKTFHCLSLPVNSTQLNSTQLSSIMLGSLFAIWNYTMALLSTKWHQKISYHGQVSSKFLTSPHIDKYLSYSHEILLSLYRCLIQLTLTITVTPYHLITLMLILMLTSYHLVLQVTWSPKGRGLGRSATGGCHGWCGTKTCRERSETGVYITSYNINYIDRTSDRFYDLVRGW